MQKPLCAFHTFTVVSELAEITAGKNSRRRKKKKEKKKKRVSNQSSSTDRQT
jgi:hypothetical protein